MRHSWYVVVLVLAAVNATAGAADLNLQMQEIERELGVGYAVRLLDMNADGKTDILVVDTNRVVWYQNPSWQRHTLIQDQTKKDNVCIAPYDIDGDGHVDFALGADWRPFDTVSGGTIQWLTAGQDRNQLWQVLPIGEEPTVHRIQWADFDGDGRAELIVVPLMGRGTTKPEFSERPLRILSYQIPRDPRRDPWKAEVLCEEVHVAHNFEPTDLNDDGRLDLLVASFEGVSLLERDAQGKWSRKLLGGGNQQTRPNRGASEIKRGRAGGVNYIATIEPWHGNQVVCYTPPTDSAPTEDGLWRRHVLDEQLQWGHAVWCADLDGDADQELVIGVRDNQSAGEGRCGVRIFDPRDPAAGQWDRQLVDIGGVAVEDLAVADLDDDGRQDIVAVGRATKNVRIYWNKKP